MSDQLAVARLQVARQRPYYAAVLWAFQPTPVKDLMKKAGGPMAVDKYLRLYYDPDVVATEKPDRLAAIMVHEIGHVLRAHSHRQGGRDAIGITSTGVPIAVWNIAGDLEINDDLAAEKLDLGPNACYPINFKFQDGLMAEEYYDLLMSLFKDAPKVGQAQCGSVSGGQQPDYEQGPEGTGPLPPGVSEAEQELMRQRVAQDVEAHQKVKGDAPAWLVRWAKERLTSKVDWRRMLAAYIRSAVAVVKGQVDYTYQRPGRRSGASPDFVWPSMRQPVPHVAVVVDTSGSMSDKELAQALAEIEGVLTSQGQRQGVTVLSVDAAVHATQKVFKASDVKLVGGGGTDMTLGLKTAEALKPRPHVIILVTDCETGWPEAPLRVPLIVARTSKGSPAPEWAKVVDVIPTK